MADYEKLQAKLAELAAKEAEMRTERKALEHELAAAKKGRPYEGPVFDSNGDPVSSHVEGVSASADADGKAGG
jgi:hypothetical protein